MTAINATVMSAAAAMMPSQGTGSNQYGPALYSTPVLTENPGAGYGVDAQTADNATNGLVTAPATVVGIGVYALALGLTFLLPEPPEILPE